MPTCKTSIRKPALLSRHRRLTGLSKCSERRAIRIYRDAERSWLDWLWTAIVRRSRSCGRAAIVVLLCLRLGLLIGLLVLDLWLHGWLGVHHWLWLWLDSWL
jgi:hypothetical protein